jgi:glutamate racemase
MTKKLAIIHTTPVTIDALKELAAEMMPDCKIINFVDDSILPQLAANDGRLEDVKERLCAYAVFAEKQGVDCILNACSSVGGVVSEMLKKVTVPVIRIDEAMAEKAVQSGEKIGVVATLNTTLQPTLQLLKQAAEKTGASPDFTPILCEEAYRKLIAGDKEGHDVELAKVLSDLVKSTDVVVLAQASMARVVATLPQQIRGHFLSSPRLGMEQVTQVLNGKAES